MSLKKVLFFTLALASMAAAIALSAFLGVPTNICFSMASLCCVCLLLLGMLADAPSDRVATGRALRGMLRERLREAHHSLSKEYDAKTKEVKSVVNPVIREYITLEEGLRAKYDAISSKITGKPVDWKQVSRRPSALGGLVPDPEPRFVKKRMDAIVDAWVNYPKLSEERFRYCDDVKHFQVRLRKAHTELLELAAVAGLDNPQRYKKYHRGADALAEQHGLSDHLRPSAP